MAVKKRGWPSVSRQNLNSQVVHRNPVRRSKKKNKEDLIIRVMYANIQGFTGKKTCLEWNVFNGTSEIDTT